MSCWQETFNGEGVERRKLQVLGLWVLLLMGVAVAEQDEKQLGLAGELD